MRLIDGLQARSSAVVRRTRVAIGLARAIDAGLAAAGLSAPVLFVSGFWRSGTTWLQESLATSLGAKTVFEPLSPMDARRRVQIARMFENDEDRLQAFIPPPGLEDPLAWTLFDHACSGRHGSPFLMSCRETVGESFRRSIVVKDVRMQSNLPGIHRRLGIPIVHIRRHPCAVVTSLVAARWHWSFSRLPLSVMDLGALGLTTREQDRLDDWDTDEISRIAVVWALSERSAARALDRRPWGRIIGYETFCADPAATISALCDWIGCRQVMAPNASKPSASVHPDRFVADRKDERWRVQLSAGAIARVEAIVSDIFPEWRTADNKLVDKPISVADRRPNDHDTRNIPAEQVSKAG